MIQGYSFDQSFTKAGKLKLIEGIRFYYIIPESSFDYKFGEFISSCRLIVSFVNLYLYYSSCGCSILVHPLSSVLNEF